MRLSRAVEVQQAVKELIVSRRLAAGDPLPTETELMEELGASRNSVREALKALQAVGIVDIRHGFGMFVGRMSLNGLVDELAFHSRIRMHDDGPRQLGHLVEIREVLEAGLVERLIDLGDAADLSPVAEVMARMSAEAEVGVISPETDRLFHDVLYRRSATRWSASSSARSGRSTTSSATIWARRTSRPPIWPGATATSTPRSRRATGPRRSRPSTPTSRGSATAWPGSPNPGPGPPSALDSPTIAGSMSPWCAHWVISNPRSWTGCGRTAAPPPCVTCSKT